MIIFNTGQWLIDTIGKLGPASVAIAVYLANRRQSIWNSNAVVRTANLEDQKMRLALLDRRLAVIRHLQVARDKAGPIMKGSDALGAVLDALREAELVFEDEDQQAITVCLHAIISFQSRYGNVFTELTGDDLRRAVEAYQVCVGAIQSVLIQLREASRVTALPPLSPLI